MKELGMKKRTKFAAAALLFSLGAGLAAAQPSCAICTNAVIVRYNLGFSYEVTTPAPMYVAVNACIGGGSTAFGVWNRDDYYEEIGCPSGDDFDDPNDPSDVIGACGDLLSVGTVTLTGDLTASALTADAYVTGTFGINSGGRTQSSDSYTGSSNYYVIGYGLTGHEDEDSHGFAVGVGSIQWVLPSGTGTFGVKRGYDYGDNSVEFITCEEHPRTSSVIRIDYSESLLTVTSPGPSVTTYPIQGAAIYYDDGSVTRLGAFTDSSFVPSTTGGVVSIDGELEDNRTINRSTLGTVTVDLTERSFSTHTLTGDADNDGIKSQCDRVYVDSLDGATIGDGVYDILADLDLDGDVDSDDLDLATAMGCPADYNCDGVVDYPDYLDFMNDFGAPNAAADINFDGVVDYNDYLDFLNYFIPGC